MAKSKVHEANDPVNGSYDDQWRKAIQKKYPNVVVNSLKGKVKQAIKKHLPGQHNQTNHDPTPDWDAVDEYPQDKTTDDEKTQTSLFPDVVPDKLITPKVDDKFSAFLKNAINEKKLTIKYTANKDRMREEMSEDEIRVLNESIASFWNIDDIGADDMVSIHMGGYESLPDKSTIETKIEYDAGDPKDRYNIQSLGVDITIKSPNGDLLVTMSREYKKESNGDPDYPNDGTYSAYFNLFECEDEVPAGYGTDTFFHAQDSLEFFGVSSIQLTADMSVGQYAWARMGFEFADDNGRDGAKRLMNSRLDEMLESEEIDQDTYDDATYRVDEFRYPFEFATFTVNDENIGKEVLLNSNGYQWSAYKYLNGYGDDSEAYDAGEEYRRIRESKKGKVELDLEKHYAGKHNQKSHAGKTETRFVLPSEDEAREKIYELIDDAHDLYMRITPINEEYDWLHSKFNLRIKKLKDEIYNGDYGYGGDIPYDTLGIENELNSALDDLYADIDVQSKTTKPKFYDKDSYGEFTKPTTLYHGTSDDVQKFIRIGGIQSASLLNRSGNFRSPDFESFGTDDRNLSEQVYATPSEYQATRYAKEVSQRIYERTKRKVGWVVVKVEVPAGVIYRSDPYDGDGIMIRGSIPPEWIKGFITDTNKSFGVFIETAKSKTYYVPVFFASSSTLRDKVMKNNPMKKHYPGQHNQLDHGRKKNIIVPRPVDKRTGDPSVKAVADKYLSENGLPPLKNHLPGNITPEEGRRLADAYDAAKNDPTDPKAIAAYKKFSDELDKQHKALVAAGYQMIPWEKDGQPYQNSKEMRDDVLNNKRLYFFKTLNGNSIHELLTIETNDQFRAVHDIFGHALRGNQFGPQGELNAYLDHSQMFSPEARLAMATETLFQNAWFNNSKKNEGKSVTEREYAEQKGVVFDPSLYASITDRFENSLEKMVRKAMNDEDIDIEIIEDEEDNYFQCPAHRDAPRPDKKPDLKEKVKQNIDEPKK